jgi:hypothetical protein
MKTGGLLKTLLMIILYSPNTSGFQLNFECSWQFQQVLLPVLARLGVSKSLKIQALLNCVSSQQCCQVAVHFLQKLLRKPRIATTKVFAKT